MALAKALRVSADYLLSSREIELCGVDFRKAPQAGAKDEKAVGAAVLDHIERYLELEALLPDRQEDWRPVELDEFAIDHIEAAERAADKLREKWELGIDPIQSMAELLEGKGVKVVSLTLPVDVSGSKAYIKAVDLPELPIVVVNEAHNGERQRFTMAHELAHLVLRPVGLNDHDQEKAADRFAGAFLMAKEMLLKLLGGHRTAISLGELAELKKIFKVSIASLIVRCSQIGAISKALYGRLFGQVKAMGWNALGSTEPGALQAERPQRMERLCMRAVSEGVISVAKGAELLRTSIRDLEVRLAAIEA